MQQTFACVNNFHSKARTRPSLALARRPSLRASPIPADYNDHSLDNNQQRLNLQYVSPWQVELKPNPINFVFDTYSLHPYTTSQSVSAPEECPASASGSEGVEIEPLLHIFSNSNSQQSSRPSTVLNSAQLSGQYRFTQPPRTVSDNPSPKRQRLASGPIPTPSSSSRPYNPASSAPVPRSNGDPGPSISPNPQAFDTPSPASPTSLKRGQSSYGCSLCPKVFTKQHLLK